MILINYGTSEYFEDRIGDKYYCKNIKTAKKKLKELLSFDLKSDMIDKYDYELIIKQFDNGNDSLLAGDLYISIDEIDLI